MDYKAYNQAVIDYSDSIYRFVLKQLHDEAGAQDIVQDTFETLWRKKNEIREVSLKQWLFKTAYHKMIDQIRKNKKRSFTEDISATTYSLSDGFEWKQTLETAFKALPEIQKSVLLLRDYEGYDYHAISEITGLSESQVKVYIYRARLKLRSLLRNCFVL